MWDTGSRTGPRWLPRWTLRLRLTVLYGGLFLAAGVVLVAITYVLVAHSVRGGKVTIAGKDAVITDRSAQLPGIPPLAAPPNGRSTRSRGPGSVEFLRAYNGRVQSTFKRLSSKQAAEIHALQVKATGQLNAQRSAELDSLLTESGIALGLTALLSIALGWLMAGRALRPLRTMGSRARGISERNLHERLALESPDDELKELGDTFDSLLARLEKAFDSQRRFVANASHELRTPITVERTLVELALSDPEPSTESLKDTCRRVLSAVEQQERLIEALLTLARGQRGLADKREVDLRELAGQVVSGLDRDGVRVESELEAASTTGDSRLLERLVANLVENAVKYNREHGWVKISTTAHGGRAALRIVNSGPQIDSAAVGELVQPFRRLNGSHGGGGGRPRGLGLGMSIVAAIAEAHGAGLAVRARAEGGLDVEVGFPPRPRPSLD